MKYTRGSTFRTAALATLLLLTALSASAQQTSTVRGYTLTLDSVRYDWAANQSTWTYTLVWNQSAYKHQLSHLMIAICAGKVTGSSPVIDEQMMKPDLTTGIIGAKWEGAIPNGVPVQYSFTLDGAYAVGPVSWSPKAATDGDGATIDGPMCFIAQPGLKVTKSCAAAAFVGDTIDWEVSVENTGNVALSVDVDDELVNLHESISGLAPGATRTFRVPFVASSTGEIINTVSASGDYYGNAVGPESASCTTTVYALSVAKTASTSYIRNFDWSLTKAVAPSQPVVEIGAGQTGSVGFVIGASRTFTDSGWNASGTISVSNPAPIDAQVVVSDDLAGFAVPVTCGGPMPVTVPAGGTIVCTWSLALPSGASRVNLGVATLLSGTSFTGSAPVEFGAPSQVIDGTVVVNDTPVCPEGFTCSVDTPSISFSDAGEVPVNMLLTNSGAMCQTFYTLSNGVSLVESDGTRSAAASFTDGVVTPRCAVGCTLTIGFWKTHAGFTGRNDDVVTQYLPQFLGTQGGAKTRVITTATEAVKALSMGYGSPSNGITKLYAQLLAAKLNVRNGASDADVASVISASDSFLANRNDANWSSLSKTEKSQVISWMALLDNYNNGEIGPGHCN